MAGNMIDNSIDIPGLRQFLQSIRLHLWLRIAVQELRRWSWVVAGLLLILAAIHSLVTAVSLTIIAAPVVAVSIAMGVRVIYRRPTLIESAAFADRKFAGKSLMTTAIEIFDDDSASRGEAAKIVLMQAGAAARSWQVSTGGKIDSSWRSTTLFAAIPFFAASILLSMPGADSRRTDVAHNVRATELTADATTEPGQGVDVDVDTLRRSLADSKADNNAERLDAETDGQQEIRVIRKVASSDSGDLPGDVAAMRSTPLPTATVEYLSREAVAIARAGTLRAVDSHAQSQYTATASPMTAGEFSVLAAAPPASDSQWSSLSHAQAAYAQRYLEASGSNNERSH